ncbi:hypothetical protein DICPUDRAFT_148170 [Dictyostelium purpureum]|uniref:Uncharacterized protein n=1 Tax=Dictyostelium purpureum TaxID=5786 RepID=F0ZAF8_DICPU|nr:uncharacterized protein DICPUDRAFT_148170 [Dictyostelium purpureum]EGC39044.1 hypothetical protein DICPUDRAFT_148170 [Dictyostelium purpureum]|eukprot:XP_003284394.1 hypothetical protein DICPUDRAFT_148170 [Dictyostelium purpureum]
MKALYQDILPDYANERENFHLMYKPITESKSLLVGFETMLNGFQNELAVEKLHKIIDEVSISDDLITEGVFATGEVEEVILKLKPFDNKTIAAGAAGCATVGGEGSTSGTGRTSTSGSTSISTGIIVAGNSSDWKDSSDSSADQTKAILI